MPTPTLTQSLLIALIQAILVVIFIFVVVPLTIFAERKVLGHIQDRLGSTRIAGHLTGLTGWMNRGMWKMGKVPVLSYWRGLPGLVGDILKMLLKEDILPTKSDKFVFWIDRWLYGDILVSEAATGYLPTKTSTAASTNPKGVTLGVTVF